MNIPLVDFGGILFFGVFFLGAALHSCSSIYHAFSHSGGKNDKKIRTEVIFDDGFEYVSHKTDREDSFLSYRIRVTEETKKRILNDARITSCNRFFKHTTIPDEYQESPTAKGVPILFQKEIGERKETQYHGRQLAKTNYSGIPNRVTAYGFDKSGRTKPMEISSYSRWSRLSSPCPADICTGRRNGASSASAAPAAATAESRKNPPPAGKGNVTNRVV